MSKSSLALLAGGGHVALRFTGLDDGRWREREHAVQRHHGLAARRQHLDSGVVREPCARRDQPPDDDVLLETAQLVRLARDGRLGEHARGLLERRGRDEAVGRQRGLRDAEQHGLRRGGALALRDDPLVLLLEPELVHELAHDELRVADLFDPDASEHLADDDLDVLVVDRDALEAVDLLHLVHEVALQLAVAEHRQVVVRVGRPVHERLARPHAVALVDADVLAARDQVLARLAIVGADDDLTHAFHEATHLDAAVDLGDDRLLLRLARLEQLRHARQAAGDVLGLRRLPRDLGDDVVGDHLGAVGHREVRPHRQRVPVPLAGGVLRVRRPDDDARLELALGILDDDLAREARHLVELLPHGHALDDLLVLDPAGELGAGRVRERIPLDEDRARLDPLVRLHLDLGAVDHRVALPLPATLVGHADLAVAVGRDQVAVAVHDRTQVVVLDHARALRLVLGCLDDTARRPADVEGPHRELRARLTDGLGGDDAHGFAELCEPPGPEVAPVAHDADPALGVARERGADAHALQTRVLDLLRELLGDLRVDLDDDLAREGVADVLRRDATQDAVAERLDDVAALDQRRRLDVLHGAAVVFAHDDVLRDVDEPPREVPGVGGLERRIREALPGAVGRREVLEDGEPLAEVRGDRRLDDLARRLRHETAHAGELADLLLAAPCTGVGHHVDRVELAALLARLELAEHLLRDQLGDVRPDVDDLVVALAVRDDAVLVLLLDLIDLLAGRGDVPLLRGRNVHVVDADAEPREGRITEADVLQLVEEGDRDLVAEQVVAAADERGDLLLFELLVHESQRLGDDTVEERPSHGRLEDLAAPAKADPRLEVDVLVVVGDPNLLRVGEEAPLAPHRTLRGAQALLGEVVDAEDHVLRRHRERRAIRRREDVVRGQHEHLGLELRLHRQRHVDRHLVAVEVGVERGADERVDLDRLALDQDGLEGLDPETMERRSPIEQDRVLLDDIFEDVPDLGPLLLDELLRRLDRGRDPSLLELPQNEGLEELERHLLRQTALMELEVRPHDDDRPARVVDTLPEQVLAEAALFALERVRQRLERAVVRTRNHPTPTTVVEQRVHGLLEHALLVADDDLGRLEVHEPLQPVVTVDDTTVQIVQVRGGEPPAVERHQRAQLRRDDGDDLEDHPLGLVARFQKGLDDLEPLDDLLPLLHRRLAEHLGPEVTRQRVEVHVAQQLPDRLGAHPDLERVGPVLLLELAGLVDRDEILLLRGRDLGVEDHVFLEVEDLLQLAQGHVQQLPDAARDPLEEPDVGDGRGELDVPHPLPAHAGAGHFDATLVTHHAGELHALVLAARALVVLRRAEDPRTEQTVTLGLERPIVDGLGLLHLAVRPVADLLGRGELDPDRVKRDGLRMPIEDAPQILGWLVLSDQAAERPIRQHSVSPLSRDSLPHDAFFPSFMISSTSSARLWSSFTRTLNDSGVPGSRKFSPFTIAS